MNDYPNHLIYLTYGEDKWYVYLSKAEYPTVEEATAQGEKMLRSGGFKKMEKK